MGQVSVCLTFDFDAISVKLGARGTASPSEISRGEFGAVGAPRLLALLKRHEIRTTWFIPGHTIETYPETARAVAAAGHEVGHHNYCHENPRGLSPDEERRILERGISCIEKLTGARPRGYRSPAWDHSPQTVELLVELGFAYDSSLMADDFTPYYCRTGDTASADGPFQFGPQVPLVEVPVDWTLDDWPYFGLNWQAHHIGLRTPNEVFEVWAGEFDYMYANIDGGVFTLTMHPQIIGRGSRLLMLERLISHIAGRPGVAFRPLAEVAEAFRAANPFPTGVTR
ncbi:MAG: polysaccharide deacetylase family protein [Dehalococcoidia bacterium]